MQVKFWELAEEGTAEMIVLPLISHRRPYKQKALIMTNLIAKKSQLGDTEHTF
jgi:hypothetical protein